MLALAATVQQPAGYTATVQQRVDLGLPDLSALTGNSGSYGGSQPSTSAGASGAATGEALQLLTTDQDAHVRVGHRGFKVQLTTGRSERSLTVDRTGAWTWDWDTKAVVRYTFPTAPKLSPQQRAALGRLQSAAPSALSALNPQSVAQALLNGVDADTSVNLGQNVRVAGHDAYELVFTPKQRASLIRDVRLAVDAETGMYLRAQVWAKAGDKLAYSLAYNSLGYGEPKAADLTFTPPLDAKVTRKQLALPKFPETQVPGANRMLISGIGAALKEVSSKPAVGASSSGLQLSDASWTSVVHLPVGTLSAAELKRYKSLFQPLGRGAYGLQSTLISIRVDANGSVALGSVPLANLS